MILLREGVSGAVQPWCMAGSYQLNSMPTGGGWGGVESSGNLLPFEVTKGLKRKGDQVPSKTRQGRFATVLE